MSAKEKRKYFLWYSILFPVMLFGVHMLIWKKGGSLIKSGDSLEQHCRAFVYYGQYLRRIVRTLLTEHRLVIPEWDFSIGYGSGIISTLHYYVIGDPLTLLSVFVPTKYALYMFQFLIMLRYYLAGLSFSCFAIYMGKKNPAALLAGSYTYAFCMHSLLMGLWHPFFINPMIYFPLVLIGVEKVLRREKPYVLIVSVFLSAVSNFYFFYMITLLTVIYTLVRCVFFYGWRGRKQAAAAILKIGLFAFVGVMISAVILCPVLTTFLTDYRVSTDHSMKTFYAKSYYRGLLAALTGPVRPGSRTMLTYGAAALPAVVFLFLKRRKEKGVADQRTLFLISVLLLMFPMAAHVLNGFSYVANRWTWGCSLLVAFILVSSWESFTHASWWEVLVLTAVTAAYCALCKKYSTMHSTLVVLLLIWLLIVVCAAVKNGRMREYAQIVLLLLVLTGSVVGAYRLYRSGSPSNVSKFYTQEEAEKKFFSGPDKEIKEIAEGLEGFFRYTNERNAVKKNASINYGTNNTQFYWSLSNGNIARFFLQTETNVKGLYYYHNLDDRTVLCTLASCRYYVKKAGSGACVPYGYRYMGKYGAYDIYENQYALPLAYTYDGYMTHDSFDGLNGAEREDAMMQAVLLEKEVSGIAQEQTGSDIQEIFREVIPGEKVKVGEKTYTVSKKNSSITLKVDKKQAGELYVELNDFGFTGKAKGIQITLQAVKSDGSVVGKSMGYRTSRSPWPTGIEDYIVNLGYFDEPVDTVIITFGNRGKYHIGSLHVWNHPMESYVENVKARGENAWMNEEIGTDRVSGEVDLEKDKFLLLTIPYDGGWSAYVDGQKQEVLQANVMFSALKLPAGHHSIELVYRTPGIVIGFWITLAGLAAFVIIFVVTKRKSAGKGEAQNGE